MKRKRDITVDMNVEVKNKELRITKPKFLKCDICGNLVKDYEMCSSNIFCSDDCYSVAVLSLKYGYLDEKNNKRNFDESELIIL